MSRPAAALLIALACAITTPPALHAGAPEEVDLAKAKALLAAGKSQAAHDALLALVERTPADIELTLALGQAQLALGDPDAAVSTFSNALDLAPKRPDVVFELGRALLQQARAHVANQNWEGAGFAYTDALRYLEQAAELDPKAVTPLLSAAAAAAENGDAGHALVLVERAVERDPKHIDALLDAGARRYFAASTKAGEGDLDGAKALREKCREAYEAVLAIDPKNGLAWNGLGWAHTAAAEPEKALEAFTRSVEVDPTQDGSYRELTRMLGDTKENKQKLLAILDKVVIKSKTFSKDDTRRYAQGLAYFYRAKAKGQLRDIEGLDADMKEAAKAWPGLAVAGALSAALALNSGGQYEGASARILAHTETALEPLAAAVLSDVDPRKALLELRGLADQMVRLDRLDAAREVFRLVATAQSNSSDDWNNYAFFCRETARYEESYTAYSRALELAPEDPGVLNDTALILQYHLNRDLEYAVELYERAIVAATKQLEDTSLDSRTVDAIKIALRDANNNSRMLRAALERGDTTPPRDPTAPQKPSKPQEPKNPKGNE